MRLTDGGLETTLVFERGLELPAFAAFPLLDDTVGRTHLESYWAPYLALAGDRGVGFDVDTPTWRANPGWAHRLGYDDAATWAVNVTAAGFARSLADRTGDGRVNGVVGPRGDGYVAGTEMTAEQAASYHVLQLSALAAGGVDQVSAMTLTYPAEAVGFLRSAAEVGLRAVVSFTVETDGRLPNGCTLREAVEQVDAATDASAAGFMVNCAHPDHVRDALPAGPWTTRLVGLRPNASRMSHAELDAATTLDAGDPTDLARRCRQLLDVLPSLAVLGGCCGTGVDHVEAMAEACLG